MGKNIVVFSDGTGQDGGIRVEQRLSNVYKLYRAARVGPDNDIDPAEQVAFYDPGLGTAADASGLTRVWRDVSKLMSSATGVGITTNIADCYEFIVNHYEPGDRIHLFGFSRGAYTVRCVANVLLLCGVPTVGRDGQLPRFRTGVRDIVEEAVLEVYEHGAGHDRGKFEAERKEKARRFRRRYGSENDGRSNVAPHFIGVFDTVASLGARGLRRGAIVAALSAMIGLAITLVALPLSLLPFVGYGDTVSILSVAAGLYACWQLRSSLKTIRDWPAPSKTRRHVAQWTANNFDRLLSADVAYARSANAIDETRVDFKRLGWGKAGSVRVPAPGEPDALRQLWFAGNHSDVGGSYPETESRLSDIALEWMIGEASSVPGPLLLDRRFLNLHPSPGGMQHCEVASTRDALARIFRGPLRRVVDWLVWKEEPRYVDPQFGRLHDSVLVRLALPGVVRCGGGVGPYRPEALRGHALADMFYEDEPPIPSGERA